MQKRYIVRLTDQERRRTAGGGQEAEGDRRESASCPDSAQGGRRWAELDRIEQIAEAFACRVQTVENMRQRLVERGFEETFNGAKRAQPPTEKLLDGEQEAKIIATRLGPPPRVIQLDAAAAGPQVVELGIVESISYETVRRTLKKTA